MNFREMKFSNRFFFPVKLTSMFDESIFENYAENLDSEAAFLS